MELLVGEDLLQLAPIHDTDQDTLLAGRSRQEYTSLLLTLPREQDLIVVGALALVAGPQPLAKPHPGFVESIARAIYSAGDVRSVYFDPTDSPVTVRARR